MAEKMKALGRENRELRKASAYFAQAEFDRLFRLSRACPPAARSHTPKQKSNITVQGGDKTSHWNASEVLSVAE